MKLPVRERDIQKAILDWLTVRRIFHFRTNTGAAMLPGRGGKPQLVRFGYKGVADIIGILRHGYEYCAMGKTAQGEYPISYVGQFFAIECKAPKGKQSDEQAEFQKRVEAAGGIYILARSLEDVQEVLG